MTDRPEETPRPRRLGDGEVAGIAVSDLAAIGFTIGWVLVVGIVLLVLPAGGAPTFLLVLLALAMPVGLVWAVASAARSARAMQAEAARLAAAADAIRQAQMARRQGAGMEVRPAIEEKLDRLLAALDQGAPRPGPESAAAGAPPPTPPATPPAPTPESAEQPSLALEPSARTGPTPVTRPDFLRALDFPETDDDAEGFRALRAALADRESARLLRAAQDVLTLLSQDGVFMDDLAHDRARPDLWRQFADGERGRAVSALGGVRDRPTLDTVATRMREDAIFRDAAHHFLRQFDTQLSRFAGTADDGELAALAETRSARAFMLLGRVAGTFD